MLGTVKRGVRNVLRSPIRFLLVVLLLGTSLMFVAAMFALNASAQQRVTDARSKIGTGIDISPARSSGGGSNGGGGFTGGGGTIDNESSKRAVQTEGVTRYSSSITQRYDESVIKGAITFPAGTENQGGRGGQNNFANGNGTVPPIIQGITTDGSELRLFAGVIPKLTQGRLLATTDKDANVALTSVSLAQANGWQLGSTFKLKDTTLKIVGLFSTEQKGIGENNIVLPVDTAQRVYKLDGVSSLTVYASSDTEVQALTDRLRKNLGSDFDVTPRSQAVAETLNALVSAQNNILTTLWVSFLSTALVIVFAVFIIIRERTKEIGILKAIGASHWQVIQQFGVEVMALSGTAAITASVLLAVAAPSLSKWFDVTATTQASSQIGGPGGGRMFRLGRGATLLNDVTSQALTTGLTVQTLLIVFGLGMLLAVLASIIPAWYVARIKPAQVLRQSA